jgi:hypothetical protein
MLPAPEPAVGSRAYTFKNVITTGVTEVNCGIQIGEAGSGEEFQRQSKKKTSLISALCNRGFVRI